MIYADYDYYANTYMGRDIAEEDFPRMAAQASRYIDYITKNQAERHHELEAVKLCCCSLSEQYKLIENAKTATANSLSGEYVELSSETVGSWSQSYGSTSALAENIIKNADAELAAIARRYLSVTGLLYRGVKCCYG